MTRALLLFWFAMQTAMTPESCREDQTRKWNRFANDANLYISNRANGIIDARLRKKLPGEWADVIHSDCW